MHNMTCDVRCMSKIIQDGGQHHSLRRGFPCPVSIKLTLINSQKIAERIGTASLLCFVIYIVVNSADVHLRFFLESSEEPITSILGQ